MSANINVFVDSLIFDKTVRSNNRGKAKLVAEERLDLLSQKIQSSLEHGTVEVFGKSQVKNAGVLPPGQLADNGTIVFKIKQKDLTKDGRKPRELDDMFGASDDEMSVYDNFVHRITEQKKNKKPDPHRRHRVRRYTEEK